MKRPAELGKQIGRHWVWGLCRHWAPRDLSLGAKRVPGWKLVPNVFCLFSETLTPNLRRQTGSFSSTPCTWAVAPARSLVAFTQNQLMLFSLRPGPWCFKPCADFVLASTLLSMCMWLLCYNISGFEKINNAIKTRAHSLGPSAEPAGPLRPCQVL